MWRSLRLFLGKEEGRRKKNPTVTIIFTGKFNEKIKLHSLFEVCSFALLSGGVGGTRR